MLEFLRKAAWVVARQVVPAGFVPPGHFYSPIPDFKQIRRDEARIFGPWPDAIPGVDMREQEQLALATTLAGYYGELPFGNEARPGLRYRYANPAYGPSDAIFLYGMLRHLRPKRVVEIGSGYSSCVTLDTNEHFLGGQVHVTFVEPYPQLLHSLLKASDRANTTILAQPLQAVDRAVFEQLEAGDILFVDSTHVSKIDSDVNRLFFDILPLLKPGVYVHIHDVFHPFEYPPEWLREGRAWNEIYLLRAFLQFNESFRIVLMNSFLQHKHPEFFRERMPLCLGSGGCIWLQRTR